MVGGRVKRDPARLLCAERRRGRDRRSPLQHVRRSQWTCRRREHSGAPAGRRADGGPGDRGAVGGRVLDRMISLAAWSSRAGSYTPCTAVGRPDRRHRTTAPVHRRFGIATAAAAETDDVRKFSPDSCPPSRRRDRLVRLQPVEQRRFGGDPVVCRLIAHRREPRRSTRTRRSGRFVPVGAPSGRHAHATLRSWLSTLREQEKSPRWTRGGRLRRRGGARATADRRRAGAIDSDGEEQCPFSYPDG